MNFTITKPNFSQTDLNRIDPRILQFISGWKVVEQYKGKDVIIPDIIPFNYFEALNKPEGVDEDEKQLTLWAGWAGRSNGKDIDGLYDAEVIITLAVNGKACQDQTIKRVNVEILKSGGAPMQVYFNNKLVTEFKDVSVFDLGWLLGKRQIQHVNGYQTVPDIYKLL